LLINAKGAISDTGVDTKSILADFARDNWGNILKIKSTDDLRKAQNNGLDELVIPELDPRIKLVGRYETDTKIAYLIPKPLRAWCGKQQLNYPSFIQELKDKSGAKTTKVRLTKGTTTYLPLTHVLAIDCSAADVKV
jgi:hypothetical protein